jgi:predicted transposase YbfD/YdcC
VEVLVIALAAMLCGADTCSDMAEFGQAKEGLLRRFLRLEHGIPSHDTFSRVFRLLKPEAFEAAFRRFMAAFAKANRLKLSGVVAIDGKALRGAFARGQRATPLHMVNVWAVEARMAIAQQKAAGRNETAGALEVLERGADYVLAIKANRGPLFRAVVGQFTRSGKRFVAGQLEPSNHGRRESRQATVMRNTSLAKVHGFPGAVAIGRITSRRRLHGNAADPPVVRYYLLSRYMSAKRLLQVARSHWSIENQLHWILDVHFGEDGNRARKDNAPENLAILRRLALNILQTHPDPKPIRRKIKRAGWDDAFLLAMLGHMR